MSQLISVGVARRRHRLKISSFTPTSLFAYFGIDCLFGSTEETAFPIQLAFNDRTGSFKMRPFSQETSPQSVPEFTSAIGLFALSAWGIVEALKIGFDK